MRTVFDIRDHGAVGDGRTNDAAAIQRAIDACEAWGGGRVLVPAGRTFRSGSLVLKSRVDLHLERGARLEASGDFADITERTTVSALSSGVITGETVQSGQFIAAYDAVDVAISGPGTIDGGGRFYVEADLGPIYQMARERPFTVFMINCSDVSITETRFVDPALWTVRLTGCESVQIHRIRIRGDMRLPNGDGIDLDHCRRVTISDCDVRCPDDAISLKTCEEFPDAGPCEDITVSNCVLETRSSALVIGVDARDPIRNVIFDHCVIRASHRGLSVNMGQDSVYENIIFSNMVIGTRLYDEAWWGRGEPIYVSAMPWHDQVGTIRNVRFVNVLARSENGVCIEADRPGLISGLLLENVRVELDRWSDQPGGQHDRRPYSGPDPIISRPVNGFFVRRADGVVLRNCEVVRPIDPPAEFGDALEVQEAEVDVQGGLGASVPSSLPDDQGEAVTHPPVVRAADAGARALLERLYRLSGEQTLSGQHNTPREISWYSDEATQLTGHRPAVWGQDFGFSGPGDMDGVEYRPAVVAEAIRQHRAGSVITLMWHAVRPTEDEPVTFEGSICRGPLDAEDWHDLLDEHSATHARWRDQIDVVAGYLAQLRDAGVPVLWRPYHEMNGDWFWWGGRGGVHGYAALYRAMFERYTRVHRLTNLIWVWNSNAPRHNAAGYPLCYPGHDVVDVLAADVYGDDYRQSHHDDLLALADGRPIALGEVGALPTPEILAAQPRWVWFMTWSTFLTRSENADRVQPLYGDPRVVHHRGY